MKKLLLYCLLFCGCSNNYNYEHIANIIKPDGTIYKTIIVKSMFPQTPTVNHTSSGNLFVRGYIAPIGWNIEFEEKLEVE